MPNKSFSLLIGKNKELYMWINKLIYVDVISGVLQIHLEKKLRHQQSIRANQSYWTQLSDDVIDRHTTSTQGLMI